MNRHFGLILGWFLLGFAHAWATPMVPNEGNPGDLISYEKVAFHLPKELRNRASNRAYQELTDNHDLPQLVELLVNYPVEYYRVVYLTEDKGKLVEASGLVMVPLHPSHHWPLLSYQHGTILPSLKATAPSLYNPDDPRAPLHNNFEVNLIGSVMASHGYVVAMPDYLGYGHSEEVPIQYTYTPSLARVSRDMLRATRSLCTKEDIGLTDQLYLTGYSEGAGATMALHKMLEAEHAGEFTVVAQSSMSGFYNYTRMCREFAQSDTEQLAAPIYLWSAWVLNANEPTLQRRQHEVFRHYYRKQPEHFMLKAPLLSARPKTSRHLLNKDFRNALIDGSDSVWYSATQVNDHYDWQAQAPVFLHHGAKDFVLPIFHSQDALRHMRDRGSEVTLYEYSDADHFSLIDNFLARTMNDFDALRGQQDEDPTKPVAQGTATSQPRD